jgi:hypothetical protein
MKTIKARLSMELYGYLAMKNGYCAVVRGLTIRGFAVRLIVSETFPATGTSTTASAFGLSAPLSEFFLSFALFPSCPVHFFIFVPHYGGNFFYFSEVGKLRLLFFNYPRTIKSKLTMTIAGSNLDCQPFAPSS